MSQTIPLDTFEAAAPDYQALERPLQFTSAAAAKVRELIVEEGNAELKLRVYIQGGGCSGGQYGFDFCDKTLFPDAAEVSVLPVQARVVADKVRYGHRDVGSRNCPPPHGCHSVPVRHAPPNPSR